MEDKQKRKQREIINTTTVGMAQDQLIQKSGEGASQMIQAHKGVRFDSLGNDLGHHGRSLEGISNYKVNPKYESQNIKQQSGFTAELIKEARDNKEAIKSGNSHRTRTTDGVGQTNHQQYDHVQVDQNGKVLDGSGSQMKFLGIDKKGQVSVIEQLVKDQKWDKYDGPIDIPSDQYDKAVEYANDQANKLRDQANNLRSRGNSAQAAELEAKADKYDNAAKRVRKSKVTESEAIEGRLNPKKFVTKEVLKDSHDAGIQAAKAATIMSGSITCAQNIYSIIYEDKPIEDAVVDVVKTTGKAGIAAYGIGASGTAIKSIMHSSKSTVVRRLGCTNLPAMIATGAVEAGKSIKKYADGKIDEVELLEELGEKGTGMVAAGLGAAIGAAAGSLLLPGIGTITGASVGSFVGSMIAYTASSILYKGALDALKGAKISEERRKVIEELSQRSIKELQLYQDALVEYSAREFNRRENVIRTFFCDIHNSILNNNIDGFIQGINGIGKELGLSLEFETFEEFDQAMDNEDFVLKL